MLSQDVSHHTNSVVKHHFLLITKGAYLFSRPSYICHRRNLMLTGPILSILLYHLGNTEFQSQTKPPTPPDLVLAYQILLAGQRARNPFLAFFNCGDRSGASQPHKHLQFIPLNLENGGAGAPFENATRGHGIDIECKCCV